MKHCLIGGALGASAALFMAGAGVAALMVALALMVVGGLTMLKRTEI